MKTHRVWVVEYPAERYTDYTSSAAARAAFDSIELKDGEYKYLFIAHDDEHGEFHPEFDVGLAFERREPWRLEQTC